MSLPLPHLQQGPLVVPPSTIAKYPPLNEIQVNEDMTLFSELKKEIESYASHIETLNRFKMLVSSDGKDCFDAEDVEMIKDTMKTAIERRKTLESDLKDKITIYNTNYLNLQRTIQKRKMILDDMDATSVLEKDEKLLDFFTGKQIKLEDILVQTKNKLEEGNKRGRRDSEDSMIED